LVEHNHGEPAEERVDQKLIASIPDVARDRSYQSPPINTGPGNFLGAVECPCSANPAKKVEPEKAKGQIPLWPKFKMNWHATASNWSARSRNLEPINNCLLGG
jgi:hypothetical protein